MKYTREEVVELFNEFKSKSDLVITTNKLQYKDDDFYNFLKEKGLIEQFEVGKWYKCKEYLVLIKSIEGDYARYDGFIGDRWVEGGIFINALEGLALNDDVRDRLIVEAKKRYADYVHYRYVNGLLQATDNDLGSPARVHWVTLFNKGTWIASKKGENTVNIYVTKEGDVFINDEEYVKKQ